METNHVSLIDLQKEFGLTRPGLYARLKKAKELYGGFFKDRKYVKVKGHKNEVAVISRHEADLLREYHRIAGRNG